jgi:SAM-dependent methyltransferase
VEKALAKHSELRDPRWVAFMELLNSTASSAGLSEYRTYSRIWEYPWLWFHLKDLPRNARILDIGSERSSFPWYLAAQGFDVTVSDTTEDYWGLWNEASRRLGVTPRLRVLDAQDLAVATGSVDVYESVSILEHIPDKGKALEEAARVLKPGGLLIMTFDICEPEMGMTFPDWNGRAVTMREFDGLFEKSSWFENGLGKIRWNTENIPEFLAWARTTAPHHNYVCGAIVIRRNQQRWSGAVTNGKIMEIRGSLRAMRPRLKSRARNIRTSIVRNLPIPVRSALRAVRSWMTTNR